MAYFENINEGFFNKDIDIQKNCLPIDLNKNYDWNIGRMICLNTHFNTVITQAIQNKKTIGKFIGIGSILSLVGGLAFGGIGAIAGLPVFLYTTYGVGGALLRQYDARDFQLIPLHLSETYIEDLVKINNDHFLKHPIVSVNDGEVIYVYNKIRNGQAFDNYSQPAEGNHVIIKHYDGKFFSLYGHMYQNSITVKIGDKVKKGQHIGNVGNTGNSTSPHLHFDMAFIDPRKKYSIGKPLKNFEDYKYLPLDMKNQSEQYWNEILTKPLIKNKTGILHESCFIS